MENLMTISAALISGPMYDPLYESIDKFSRLTGIKVDVGFKGDHPALNEHLDGLGDRVPYDLVSTHTKYAPSQTHFLAPLDGLLDESFLADFVPLVLDLAHINGKLYALPRNIDVRLLHYRTDLIQKLPQTWDELLELARQKNNPPGLYGFVFPGKDSGLFGTFFELAEAAGATLFPPDLIPQIENEGGRWALNLLRAFYQEKLVSPEIVDWHFDRVHNAFRDGQAAMVGDWTGYYGDYCDSQHSLVHDRFELARYPIGPSGKSRVYGGGHTFALTKNGVNKPDALELLKFLTLPEQQMLDAYGGSVPVRTSVMRKIQSVSSPRELSRWQILEGVIKEDIIIPPKFARYPEVEEVLWKTVQSAMTGHLGIDQALAQMTQQIRAIVEEIVQS
jgi:multiple sugar transport system substrate-binding protein